MFRTGPMALLRAAGALLCTCLADSNPDVSPHDSWVIQHSRDWFQDAKFGLFIHFGPYAMAGKGEWYMETHGISLSDYVGMARGFNPHVYNPREWVAIAKAAGMKYITVTTKHHDGFAMWPTKAGTWNLNTITDFRGDFIGALFQEAKDAGIKLVFYYSLLDWAHPAYSPGRTGQRNGHHEPTRNFAEYIRYMETHLHELLTKYGEVAGIWFDGLWDKPDAAWQLDQIYALIHRLQPGCLIGNNHHGTPLPGEDFQMWEKDLPGQATQAFNQVWPPRASRPCEHALLSSESSTAPRVA